MPVYLALDLGEKRVGVARSDETGTVAEAVKTVTYRNRAELVKSLREQVEILQPEKIVVGFPRTLKGEVGPAGKKVAALVDWLKGELPGEWVFWDERLTTAEAENILLEADLSRRKRVSIRDRLAAQIILQSYLDANRKR